MVLGIPPNRQISPAEAIRLQQRLQEPLHFVPGAIVSEEVLEEWIDQTTKDQGMKSPSKVKKQVLNKLLDVSSSETKLLTRSVKGLVEGLVLKEFADKEEANGRT